MIAVISDDEGRMRALRQQRDHLDEEERNVAEMSLDQLDQERPKIVTKVKAHMNALKRSFVDRDEVIEIATLCAMLGEPLLLLGPPGTGKSLLCSRFAESLHIPAEQRFEYLLTPFTEPSELFGPLDLQALREGRFIRRSTGSLPKSKVAFIDEIFKANSAILNGLLSLLNDKVYYEEGQARRSDLQIFFAASNHLPEDPSLYALSDRFTLKVPVFNTHQDHWEALINRGIEIDVERDDERAPWRDGPARYIDLLKLRRYLQLLLAKETEDQEIRDHCFPQHLRLAWRRLVTSLELDLGLYISDRKLIKLYRLIRGYGLIKGRSVVEASDLRLLGFLAHRPDERRFANDMITRELNELP